jgi:hypothetical protein
VKQIPLYGGWPTGANDLSVEMSPLSWAVRGAEPAHGDGGDESFSTATLSNNGTSRRVSMPIAVPPTTQTPVSNPGSSSSNG